MPQVDRVSLIILFCRAFLLFILVKQPFWRRGVLRAYLHDLRTSASAPMKFQRNDQRKVSITFALSLACSLTVAACGGGGGGGGAYGGSSGSGQPPSASAGLADV